MPLAHLPRCQVRAGGNRTVRRRLLARMSFPRPRRVDMDSNAAPGMTGSQPGPPGSPDLRTEVLGTLLLFLLAVSVTAGVALCAHFLVRAFS
jgi:hypothetical protein